MPIAPTLAARAAANKAMRARTDYVNADKYADMAEAAARATETARDNAKTAADAAYMAAMDAMTSADAEAERAKAMAQNRIATVSMAEQKGTTSAV